MDDVVGTGPDEHIKTSLYLTDVKVLRHKIDTVNFSGSEVTKTSRGFKVKNSTDFVESLLNLYGLEKSKPTASPGRRSTVMELALATPVDGHNYSDSRTAVGKVIIMAPWRPDTQCAIQQQSTQVLNPITESKSAAKQLIRCLKGTQHTCLRLEPLGMVQRGLLELLGRSDSDLGRRFGNTPKCYGIRLRCTERDCVQPKSETDSQRVDTKNNTADLFTKHMDGLRTQSLARKTVTTENFEQRFQSSRT